MTKPMPDDAAIREALRGVMDPEVGMNIVDLGLVYDICLGRGGVTVDLTMTTPACPMSAMICDDAERAVRDVCPSGTAVAVELVWDPPWHPGMMSEHAKAHFGW